MLTRSNTRPTPKDSKGSVPGAQNAPNPPNPKTLVELLRVRAVTRPDDIAYRFLAHGESGNAVNYSTLDRESRRIGSWLVNNGAAGRP
ncbi:MAG: hypothetical protein ACREAC_11360, partial [Blastocatellia bacterium]